MAPPFSIWILLALLAVFGASCLMFWVHVRHWTGNRQWLNLRDWATRNGYKVFPAARAAVASMLIALLPHDLGLILHGRRLILDFSTRPFDGIELSRIVALVEQLAAHLPPIK
jgi:hypothetical protein